MADEKSKLLTKVSPLIEGQVPDFIQSEHPIFVKFLKDYYKFLEAGQITYSSDVDYIIQETTTVAYINEEEFGDRIVTESGAGSTGKFVNGETITGGSSSTSGALESSSATKNPEVNRGSGEMLFLENRNPINRTTTQIEDIKVIIEF